jgi:hypothetical protein
VRECQEVSEDARECSVVVYVLVSLLLISLTAVDAVDVAVNALPLMLVMLL